MATENLLSGSTDVPINVEQNEIRICTPSDLKIKLIERHDSSTSGQDEKPIKKITTFLVSIEVIRDIPAKSPNERGATTPFRAMIQAHLKEESTQVVEIEEDSAVALEVVLRIYHDSLVDNSYVIPIQEVWEIICILDKYQFDLDKASKWFCQWYDKRNHPRIPNEPLPRTEIEDHEFQDYMVNLFPCYIFDHAKGFLQETHDAVYGSTRGTYEVNPTKHGHLRLPPRIIAQMNAARGRLRTVLFGAIHTSWEEISQERCKCHKNAANDYLVSLSRVGVWPFEKIFTYKSMDTILEMLDDYSWSPLATDSVGVVMCPSCRGFPFTSKVAAAVEKDRKYFNGLCLDCMDRSKPRGHNEDRRYWEDAVPGKWDENCRISHKEPTFYFSYMGRPENRTKTIRRKADM